MQHHNEEVTHTILHEDERVIVVCKYAGITVIPSRQKDQETSLVEELQQVRKEKVWVCHRIDRDTSGIVIFARDAETHRSVSLAFQHRKMQKTYVGWIRGSLQPKEGSIKIALHTARKGKMRPAAEGEAESLQSETQYKITGEYPTKVGVVSRVELFPVTGRQHQIRVHLRAKNAPLLVDELYGRCACINENELGKDSPKMDRLTLHAQSLTIRAGVLGKEMRFDAPLPKDLTLLDEWLKSPK